MSSSKRGSGPGSPSSGWRHTLALVLTGSICLAAFGCALTPNPPSFLPTYPDRPQFVMRPQQVQGANDTKFLVLAWPDWLQLGGYVVELERQLTGACLALGGTAVQCHADDAQ